MNQQELAALLQEPTLGPFTTQELAQMVEGWAAWNELQRVPSYCERYKEKASEQSREFRPAL